MYCYKCGKELPDAATFCAYCGADLSARAGATNKTTAPAARPTSEPGANAASAPPAPRKKLWLGLAALALIAALVVLAFAQGWLGGAAQPGGEAEPAAMQQEAAPGGALVAALKDNGSYIYDLYDDHAVIIRCQETAASIDIPAELDGVPVTGIGPEAFDDCDDFLTSVTIPDSVTSIGLCAFDYCDLLTSVVIPDSVTEIGYDAFFGTPWLDSLTAEFVIVGDGVLLAYNGNGGNITIPDGVKFISNAFEGSKELTGVIIPDSVTNICDCAFADCARLYDVSIPDSVTSIGYGAFNGCRWLVAQTDEFVIVGDGVLIDYNGAEGEVYVPEGVKQIAGVLDLFNSYNITAVHLPDSLLSIGNWAFSGCSLTSIDLPESLVSIGYETFAGCELTSISLPASVSQCDLWSFGELWLVVVAPEGSAAAMYRDAIVRLLEDE